MRIHDAKIKVACSQAMKKRIQRKQRDAYLIELADERAFLINRLYGEYFTSEEWEAQFNGQWVSYRDQPDSKGRRWNGFSKPPEFEEFKRRWNKMNQFITKHKEELDEYRSRLCHWGNDGEDKRYLDFDKAIEHYDYVVNVRV